MGILPLISTLLLFSSPLPSTSWNVQSCDEAGAAGAVAEVSFRLRNDDVRAWGWGGFTTDVGRRHIRTLCPGSRLTIEVTRAGSRHELAYQTSTDGTTHREYRVDMRTLQWGLDAHLLEAEVLPHVVRHFPR